jgi:hypothetical protein
MACPSSNATACGWRGGYAFRAHEILRRPSQDLDFATRDDTPLPEIAGHVRNAFQAAGLSLAQWTAITQAGPPARFVRCVVLEVAGPGGPSADGAGAGRIADLGQVPQLAPGVVAGFRTGGRSPGWSERV